MAGSRDVEATEETLVDKNSVNIPSYGLAVAGTCPSVCVDRDCYAQSEPKALWGRTTRNRVKWESVYDRTVEGLVKPVSRLILKR